MSTTGPRRSERKKITHSEPPQSPSMATATTVLPSRSTASSSSTRRARAELEAAEARARLVKQRAEAEAHVVKQMADAEEAVIAAKLAADIAEIADEDADMERRSVTNGVQSVRDWLESSVPPVQLVQPARMEQPPASSSTEITTLAKALIEAVQASASAATTTTDRFVSRLAMKELPSFDGNELDWLRFKGAYETSTRVGHYTEEENVTRLYQSLRGNARDAVASQLLTASDTSGIMKTLELRFGRPEAIVNRLVLEIRKIPALTSCNSDLIRLATTVESCVATIRATGAEGYLYSPELTGNIIGKLPTTMLFRWREYAADVDAAQPKLVTLARYLMLEAERACHAGGLIEAPAKGVLGDASRNSRRAAVLQTEAVSTSPPESVKMTSATPRQAKPATMCLYCDSKRHSVDKCVGYAGIDVELRWKWAKEKGVCFRCLSSMHQRSSCRAEPCAECHRNHHRSLHSTTASSGPELEANQPTVANIWEQHDRRVLLKVLPVTIQGSRGEFGTFALLDEGATVSLIDQSVADRIGADGPPDALRLQGASGMNAIDQTSRRVRLTLLSDEGRFELEDVRTVRNLSLPRQAISNKDVDRHAHLRGLPLVTYGDATPTLLIGQDHWDLVVSLEIRSGHRNVPAASLTKLGWVLHGNAGSTRPCGSERTVLQLRQRPPDEYLHAMVKEHFALESLAVTPRDRQHAADARALEILSANTRRINGHWQSNLLWKTEDVNLPNNRDQATRRLVAIESKMTRDPEFAAAYRNEINNLLKKGYARRLSKEEEPQPGGKTWFLPHFAVSNHNKKMRLVFDAAAATRGICLNDALLTGPDLLHSLLGVLFRFRERPVAVTGDIREMFLQIGVSAEDRPAQCFLWREDRTAKPDVYQMTSLIFGATSSPATAIYVRDRNADEFAERYPRAVAAIKRRHYMDDYLDSVDTEEEARRLVCEVKTIHAAGGFEMRSWASNRPAALAEVEERWDGSNIRLTDDGRVERTLGLRWSPTEDRLGFDLSLRKMPRDVADGRRTPTKREMLAAVMSVFDPLGFLAPFTVQAKTLLQEVWRSGIGWDDQLGDTMAGRWNEWLHTLKSLETCAVPRCYGLSGGATELHVFCDASEMAYGAVAYWRSANSVAFIASKGRVAPLKPMTIPRLELQAAMLATRLADTVMEEHDFKVAQRVFWTDSRTVLAWIRAEPRSFKAFVAHRLAEIDERTEVTEWRWVPSQENAADDATRNTANVSLRPNSRWLCGPPFLHMGPEHWPSQNRDTSDPLPVEATAEARAEVVAVTLPGRGDGGLPATERFSSWRRLVRSAAYVLCFIDRRREGLVGRHLEAAERMLIRRSQGESFPQEIAALKEGKAISTRSRLRRLSPALDSDGVLRLVGRLGSANGIPTGLSVPAILDGRSSYARLLIDDYHRKLGHGGNETVVNEIRQRFWILNLRPAVRTLASKCVMCRVRNARPTAPIMADLPTARLGHHKRPFTYTGLDYFGPMEVAVGRRREKRYGALFTCLTTRAVHLELAASLSTDSAIMAVRRMAARRGWPLQIWSDNGTNFRGADVELRKAFTALDIGEFRTTMITNGVDWRFIPPAAPHMGGSWERLVRSVKAALRAVLRSQAPKEEVLLTLMAEAEHTVNSRPLTHVSTDERDPEALTPNHFLLGSSSGLPLPGAFTDDDLCLRKQWRIAQRFADQFWRRWLREYLPTLHERSRWTSETAPLAVGDLVIIADPSNPRNIWPRGRVSRLLPGRDGRIRVVDVTTRGGILRRPAHKIISLAIRTEGAEVDSGTGGEYVADAIAPDTARPQIPH